MPRGKQYAASLILLAGLTGTPDGSLRTPVPSGATLPITLAQTVPASDPETENTATGTSTEATAAPDDRERGEAGGQGVIRSGVPEGFEAYMAPQRTLVDIFFGGRFILSAMAEFTPESIEFENPAKIVNALPRVAVKAALINHLSGPLPTHGDRVCDRPGEDDCGTLKPDFIGVIFDERSFRADVFVHPDLLAAPSAPPSYLPDPEEHYTGLVQNLSINHAGSDDGEDNFSLFGNTRLGSGEQHLFSNWIHTDQQELSVDELALRKDFTDHQVTAGLYEPMPRQLTILRRQPLVGIGIRRSFERRLDLETAFATDIELFLASRSRVSLYKDGRLYDSRFYETGNQRLETGRLPPGAYNLEIRITDTAGRTRTLERFFVKSQRLAPTGELIWFSHLGRLHLRDPNDEFPEDAGTVFTSGGLQYRVREDLALGLAGAAIEDAGLLEFSADWLTPGWQGLASLFASTEGGAGWQLRGSVAWRRLRVTLDTQRVWAETPDAGAEYVLLPEDLERDSAEFRLPAGGGQWSLSWQRQQSGEQPEIRTTSLGYDHTLRIANRQLLTLNASLSRNNGDDQALVGVSWRYNNPHWQHQASLNWRDTDRTASTDGVSARAATTWRDADTFEDELQIGASVETDEDTDTLSLDARHDSQYGRGLAGVTRNHSDAGERTLTSLTYDTNLVASGKAAAMGGTELNEAGLIIDLRGAEDALFDVLINGRKRFVARGGQRAALTLPGYEQYRVAIQDRGTRFVHYDHREREVTLFPGNVASLDWELQPIIIVLGVLTDPASGEPLGGAIIKGTRDITTTDVDGYFQGEILGRKPELMAEIAGRECRLDLPQVEVSNGVARLGRVPCRETTPTPQDGGEGARPATPQ